MMEKIQPDFSWGRIFQKHLVLPAEHGAWVFLFSPLLIGLFAGKSLGWASLALVIAAGAAFLVRQPVTVAVKVASGRRPIMELAPAVVWIGFYGLVCLVAFSLLALQGYGYIGWLALPALPVLSWHLWLVSRRAERHAAGVEIVASGVLALVAPAAAWVGRGAYSPSGWLLWVLCWMQSAVSILYAYLRLEQRRLPTRPDRRTQAKMGWRANLVAWSVVMLAAALALGGMIPGLVVLAFVVQGLEVLWGTFHPAVKVRPAVIGFRQLVVSMLFTLVFILGW